MARDVRLKRVTINPGGTAAAPQVFDLSFPSRRVTEVEILVPPGPNGQLHFSLGAAGVPTIPAEAGAFLAPNDEVIRWPLEGWQDSGSWQLFAWNAGTYAHTLEIRFLCELNTAPSTSPNTAIDPSLIFPSAGGGAGAAFPPGVAVTPPPPPSAPPPIGAPPSFTPPPVGVPSPSAPSIVAAPPVNSGAPPSTPTTPAGGARVVRPIPTRMYDSTTAGDIPAGASMVAWYDYVPSSIPATFSPEVFYVHITKGDHGMVGDVLDVETGAAPPSFVIPWVNARRAAGADPVVYATAATHGAIASACIAAGITPPRRWLAMWDGNPAVPAGYIAKQYANPPLTGHHYDLSAVLSGWPGLAAWAGYGPAVAVDNGTFTGGTYDMTAQEYAAVVKLAYEVLGLRKELQAMGKGAPPEFAQDVTDPQGFAAQVNAAINRTADLHAIVNSITEAA